MLVPFETPTVIMPQAHFWMEKWEQCEFVFKGFSFGMQSFTGQRHFCTPLLLPVFQDRRCGRSGQNHHLHQVGRSIVGTSSRFEDCVPWCVGSVRRGFIVGTCWNWTSLTAIFPWRFLRKGGKWIGDDGSFVSVCLVFILQGVTVV